METKIDTTRESLPMIIVTNASGFIGRNFINNSKENFRIIAVAGSSQLDAGIPNHPNIVWVKQDINKIENVEDFASEIITGDTIECVIHLSESHLNNYKKNKESNVSVSGTTKVLELARLLNAKHFILESSLEVYKKSNNSSDIINEESIADNTSRNAINILSSEEAVRKYSKHFKCSILRMGNVYSDWCENPMLYQNLNNWLSEKASSRIISGKGNTADHYIHINDLVNVLNKIIESGNRLPHLNYFIACAPSSISHNEIFNAIALLQCKSNRKVHVHQKLLYLKNILYKLNSKNNSNNQFNKIEISKTDKQRSIDNRHTRKTLNWQATRRYDLLRRLYILIENQKENYSEWIRKNESLIYFTNNISKNKSIQVSVKTNDDILKKLTDIILDPFNGPRFKFLQSLGVKTLDAQLRNLITSFSQTLFYSNNNILFEYSEKTTFYLIKNESDIAEFRSLIKSFYSLLLESPEYITLHHTDKNFNFEKISYMLQSCIDKAEEYFERHNETLVKSYQIENTSFITEDLLIKNNDEKKDIRFAKIGDHFSSKIFMN